MVSDIFGKSAVRKKPGSYSSPLDLHPNNWAGQIMGKAPIKLVEGGRQEKAAGQDGGTALVGKLGQCCLLNTSNTM